MAFGNIVGKRESAGNHHFLFFSTIFSSNSKTDRAKYPNVGIPVFTTPLTICEVKFIFTSPINHLTLPDHDFKMIFLCHDKISVQTALT